MGRIQILTNLLDQWIPNPQPSLSFTSPYTLLIATVLSARCRDKTVEQVTPLLFQYASTPTQMAALSEEEISQIIHPCGYFRTKAKAIKALSKMLCERFNGDVPASFEELETLPGVGHKTAYVVLGHAFGIPTFPVDTHVQRLAFKWGLSKKHDVKHIEQDLKALFPASDWYKRHLQFILFGRQYCNRIACSEQHPCAICKALKVYR